MVAIWNERIKKRRKELGLTLIEVAEKLGVSEATAQRYESGAIKNIPYDSMCVYSDILKTTPTYLMGWEELEQDTKVTKEDLSKIGTTPEKIKDDILNLKPFNNIVDAITFIKEYEVKFFAELDLSNKTINDVIDLVNNILENTQDTI
jgi:Predicted transcriptional regulators